MGCGDNLGDLGDLGAWHGDLVVPLAWTYGFSSPLALAASANQQRRCAQGEQKTGWRLRYGSEDQVE